MIPAALDRHHQAHAMAQARYDGLSHEAQQLVRVACRRHGDADPKLADTLATLAKWHPSAIDDGSIGLAICGELEFDLGAALATLAGAPA